MIALIAAHTFTFFAQEGHWASIVNLDPFATTGGIMHGGDMGQYA
jgi:hypothetical protein